MKNNNGAWMWTFWILFVVALIAIGVHAKYVKNEQAANAAAMNQTSMDGSTLDSSEDLSAGSVDAQPTTTGTAPVSISYANALIKYAKARFQFDPSCQAMPAAETFTNGTNVMLDNRSANPLTLHLGTIGTFSVKAWGFKIVNLTGSPLPSTILIDCNGDQNVASIMLQK